MKTWMLLPLLLAATLRVSAQLPPGSVAPDFTAQDITGQTWRLYDLLAQDKIVILEFTATWCAPCWAFHNSQALQNFYLMHGPAGDDRVRVLSIEGDPATNVACLYGGPGCNNFTQGNYVENTPYPIFDNSAIADSFHITYYPTIFVVCPNKKVFEVGQLNPAALWEKAVECPVALGVYNAGIFDYHTGTAFHEVCDTLTLTPAFRLTNLGSAVLSTATIDLRLDNNVVETITWSGYLPVYGEDVITFAPLQLTSMAEVKTVITNINNGATDADFSNNIRTNDFLPAQQVGTQKVVLKIRTDNYGSETYWELHDEMGNRLDFGGNENIGLNGGGMFAAGVPPGPGTYGNNATVRDTLVLPASGCYSLHMIDAYGDGMCCNYGNGYYKVYNLDNTNIPILSGGEFDRCDKRTFGAQFVTTVATTLQSETVDVELFPNPAHTVINLDYTLYEPARTQMTVFNTLGQTVFQSEPQTLSAGNYTQAIPVQEWAKGMYLLQLQIGEKVVIRRFLVE